MKTIKHNSNRMDRARDFIAEGIFLELWQEMQVRQVHSNHGFGALDLILNNKMDFAKSIIHGTPMRERLKLIDGYSQRDAYVAASVIQWLGTREGAVFIVEAERRIEEAQKAAAEKFHRVHNLGLPA